MATYRLARSASKILRRCAIEGLKFRMTIVRSQETGTLAVVAGQEKGLPQHLFERVGAVWRHHDAIVMGAFAGSSGRPTRDGLAPPARKENQRIILRAVGGHAGMGGDDFVKEGAARVRGRKRRPAWSERSLAIRERMPRIPVARALARRRDNDPPARPAGPARGGRRRPNPSPSPLRSKSRLFDFG